MVVGSASLRPYAPAMPRLRLASQREMARAAAELAAGRPTWFVSLGTSMRPSIAPVQTVRLRPVTSGQPLTGQVALARVGPRLWLHRILDERPAEVLVGADNGMVNGWTPREAVFGILL